jgi:hypothetical protein
MKLALRIFALTIVVAGVLGPRPRSLATYQPPVTCLLRKVCRDHGAAKAGKRKRDMLPRGGASQWLECCQRLP